MSAKKLTTIDWQHIISCIDQGYNCGEIYSIQESEELKGWWLLTEEGIIVKI